MKLPFWEDTCIIARNFFGTVLDKSFTHQKETIFKPRGLQQANAFGTFCQRIFSLRMGLFCLATSFLVTRIDSKSLVTRIVTLHYCNCNSPFPLLFSADAIDFLLLYSICAQSHLGDVNCLISLRQVNYKNKELTINRAFMHSHKVDRSSVSQSVRQSVRPSVGPSVRQSVRPSVRQPVSWFVS